MSNCYNCGTSFTLKEKDVFCDGCGKVVNFPCKNCKKWFSILNENKTKIEECKICGYFICPNCGSCDTECLKSEWYPIIKEIFPDIKKEQLSKLIKFIEDIKIDKTQRVCFRGVPISYAKGRNKSCFIRLLGYKNKGKVDFDKFQERYNQILDVKLGTILSINQIREPGSYGQEFRDVFNLAICMGKLRIVKKRKEIDNEIIEYNGYERIELGTCGLFDAKNMVFKICPNKNCKIKKYPLNENYCVLPECKYKKGKNKGELRKLKISISNKDICQLNRENFKKDGRSKSS